MENISKEDESLLLPGFTFRLEVKIETSCDNVKSKLNSEKIEMLKLV